MRTKVAVGKAVHEPVSQGIQLIGGAGLSDASASITQRSESSHRDHSWPRECGRRWRGEVHMKLEKIQVVGSKKHQVVGRSRWRRRGAVHIGRKQSADGGTLLETYLCGRLSSQHGGTVISAGI